MTITKLADAQADFDHWKEVRRGYLTSSEVYGWREVDVPDWYAEDNNPSTILAGKQGVEKTFDKYTETLMAHGSFDEQHVQEKFAYAVGCEVQSDNGLYHNDRWSHIAASVDGFGRPWDWDYDLPKVGVPEPEVHPEISQDRTLFPYLRDVIDSRGTEFITEIKRSTSSKWQKQVPEYYVDQVKTQLSVLEIPYAIIMADTLMRHPEQKWRQVWDFRAYIIEHDPAWDLILDEVNENFKTALDLL